jgi:alkanesulfonate monooxygenase SsuD/methylene tetrahydromethanopterin reductase-like flavin-dependent oxidoreductase (luciferase family)
VHPVTHHGAYYDMEGIHLSEPSPQRTPVLFQAGSSAKGQRFAASHSECVFVAGGDRGALKSSVARLREEVALQGRQPSDVIVFAMMTVIVGETDAAAQRKLEDYQSYVSTEGALALMSGWSGIDYSRPPDAVSRPGNAIQGAAGRSAITDPRAAAERTGLAGASPVVVGSPSRVADELETWMNETGIDGFNLTRQVMPETFVDFVELVVPELQRRGVYKHDYVPGTLREKLFGEGPRLQAPHPGARFRWGAKQPELQAAE